MYNKLRHLLRGSYLRNISLTGGGALLTALIGLVVSPILSRIFTPEAYGQAGLYTQSLGYISLIGGLMLTTAIVVVRQSKLLYDLLSGLKYLYVFTTLFLFLLLLVARHPIQTILNDTSDGWWLWLLPIGFLLGQMVEVAKGLNIRASLFGVNAKAQVVSNTLHRTVTILGGWGSGGYYLWLALGPLIGILPYAYFAGQERIRKLFKIRASRQALRSSLQKLQDYPRYLLPGNLIGMLADSLPFFLLTIAYSPVEAGLFLFATTMTNIPTRFASKAIMPVYLREIASSFHENKPAFEERTRTTIYFLFALGLIPYSVLAVFGTELFGWVFGSQWVDAGSMACLLAGFTLFRMYLVPLAGLFRVAEQERVAFRNQLVMFVLRTGFIIIGLQYTLLSGVLLYSIGSWLGYGHFFYQHCRISGLSFWRILSTQVALFSATVLMLYVLRLSIM